MSTAPKRNLRNSNTCPIVPNPLLRKQDQLEIDSLFPSPLRAALPTPTLTCAQITSLCPLAMPRAAEEALKRMQAATEWQAVSVRAMGELARG